jgi:hypothetical protein
MVSWQAADVQLLGEGVEMAKTLRETAEKTRLRRWPLGQSSKGIQENDKMCSRLSITHFAYAHSA